MLQLRHVLFGRRFLRECPGQHELGLEYRPRIFDPTVKSSGHPPQDRMPDPLLNIRKNLTRIGLIPAAVQLFGRKTKLDNEIARGGSIVSTPFIVSRNGTV